MSFIIGGDFVPTKSNAELFKKAAIEELFGEDLLACLEKADFRVFNLETALCNTEAPIGKNGPNLRADEETVNACRAIRADAVALANNHIMDQGAQGLRSTIRTLDGAGIGHFGAGENLAEAAKPFIRETKGRTIGFYACAEHEFSIAGEKTPGANPFDPLEALDHIVKLKEECDYVVVLYHGGKEHYRYPSPALLKVCRKIVEKGADLVICQHSHCVGCREKYGDGTIVYGQGNFLFAGQDREEWQTGLLISVDDDFRISFIPLVRAGNTVRLAKGREAEEILRGFHARSEEIKTDGFIEEKYGEFAEGFLEKYLYAFAGKESVAFRAFNKASGGSLRKNSMEKKYTKKQLTAIRNYVECEAHRELLLKALSRNL